MADHDFLFLWAKARVTCEHFDLFVDEFINLVRVDSPTSCDAPELLGHVGKVHQLAGAWISYLHVRLRVSQEWTRQRSLSI